MAASYTAPLRMWMDVMTGTGTGRLVEVEGVLGSVTGEWI
eukprot:CAMPEP_0173256794 /NCGR_PEP_ID=MMETSP1142-20121109/23374_1 /TAXON_ID=483371 /ORGANISM="non described non described, Strain CCMP2298" /LENGTH=39 /DNA_ID= /DNA_START= /DNA_END= /DNA_ORIENTATION=